MEPMHSLLTRQIRRYLGGLDSFPKAWQGFVDAVNQAYFEFDADRGMLERSIELSSQELLKANSAMRAVFERLIYSSMDGIFAFDREWRYTVWNPALERILGLSKLQTLGKSAFEVFPRLKESGGDKFYRDTLAGKTVVDRDRLYIVPGTGEQRCIEGHFSPLLDDADKIIGGLAILRDITERKRAEEALRESEQRFRDYAETASDTIWETGPDHRFTRISSRLPMDFDPASRIGVRRWDVAIDVEEEPEKWRLHIATLEAHQPFRGFRYRRLRADGSVAYIESNGKPVFDAEARFLGYRGVSSDVTAAVRADQAEAALHQAQAALAHVTRVMTLGELTSSIAHEINQPLAAIVTNGNACVRWLAGDLPNLEEARQAVGRIIRDGHRASDVIQRIRALVQQTPPQKDWLDVDAMILEVIALVRSEVERHRVSLQTHLSPDVPRVLGDRIQLQQVLLNLLMNAIEALSSVDEGERELRVSSGTHASHGVLVAVQDSGIGIDPEHMDRLFNAFFTTKPQGMGLGLAISHSIIEAHGGRLWASPNPGRGATFQFTLPRPSARQT
jgi:PAS domain S-box-containing protein